MNDFLGTHIELHIRNLLEKNRLKIARRRMRDRSNPFDLPDEEFRSLFKLTKHMMRFLIEEIRPHSPEKRRATAIPLELKILTAVNFYLKGGYQYRSGNDFNLGLSQPAVSRCITQISDLITEHLMPHWIVFPQTEDSMNRIKAGFMDKFQFPGVLGIVDGSHINIIAPSGEDPIRPGITYRNHNGFYSINVQFVCDSDLRIINCNARFPGSAHDCEIWELCAVRRLLEEEHAADTLGSSWILGDSGYPLQPWLMTPILNAVENSSEDNYNKAHILARSCVEKTLGALKQRFRCLLQDRTLRYHPTKAAKIIYACSVLHNFFLTAGLLFNDETENHDSPLGIQLEDREVHVDDNETWLNAGLKTQRKIVTTYFQ